MELSTGTRKLSGELNPRARAHTHTHTSRKCMLGTSCRDWRIACCARTTAGCLALPGSNPSSWLPAMQTTCRTMPDSSSSHIHATNDATSSRVPRQVKSPACSRMSPLGIGRGIALWKSWVSEMHTRRSPTAAALGASTRTRRSGAAEAGSAVTTAPVAGMLFGSLLAVWYEGRFARSSVVECPAIAIASEAALAGPSVRACA